MAYEDRLTELKSTLKYLINSNKKLKSDYKFYKKHIAYKCLEVEKLKRIDEIGKGNLNIITNSFNNQYIIPAYCLKEDKEGLVKENLQSIRSISDTEFSKLTYVILYREKEYNRKPSLCIAVNARVASIVIKKIRRMNDIEDQNACNGNHILRFVGRIARDIIEENIQLNIVAQYRTQVGQIRKIVAEISDIEALIDATNGVVYKASAKRIKTL